MLDRISDDKEMRGLNGRPTGFFLNQLEEKMYLLLRSRPRIESLT